MNEMLSVTMKARIKSVMLERKKEGKKRTEFIFIEISFIFIEHENFK